GGGTDSIFFAGDERLLGYRQSQASEDLVGLLLVGGQLNGNMRSATGDRRLNSLLIFAVSELDQALRIEPDPGNATFLGGVHQRGGAGTEVSPLRELDERFQFGLEVKFLWDAACRLELMREQAVEQGEGEVARLQADVGLLVLKDHVVLAAHIGRAGLAESDFLAGGLLQFDGDVFHYVPQPRSAFFPHPADEAAGLAIGTAMLRQARQRGV